MRRGEGGGEGKGKGGGDNYLQRSTERREEGEGERPIWPISLYKGSTSGPNPLK